VRRLLATLSHHRVATALAVVLPLVAIGAFVTTQDDDGPGPGGPAPTTSPTVPGAAVLPLLGTSGEVPDRPALAVKIDDTESGRPQSGLSEADVVLEEVVEGGLTRLLAVYHSQDAASLGPVRSARSTDIGLLAELGRPLFAWSGANPTFAAAVRAADLVDVGAAAAPDAYRRESSRRAPYNLYADPEALRAAGGDGDGPPAALFGYLPEGDVPAGPGVVDATGWATTPGGGLATSVEWTWDGPSRTWQRTQDGTAHVDADGTRVGVANVVIRATPYRDSGVRDSAGGVVPEAVTVGEGDAWLLSAGRAQPARWHKEAPDGPTAYTDLDGGPLRLTPGRTWVEVLPPGSGDVTGGA
jgi:hypothetical protein